MTFLEGWARPLAILHLIVAAVLVGAATHHLLWCRQLLRGRATRLAWERRFTAVTAVCFLVTFALGALQYPTYRVRTRAEFFDSPTAQSDAASLRRQHAVAAPVARPSLPTDLAWVAHLFDVKEHWVALGAAAAIVLMLLAYGAHPRDFPETKLLYVGLSLFVTAIVWLAGIIGAVTASYHAVGGGGL